MQNHIIIVGHGQYASGTKSTVELIAGPQQGVDYWDFGIDWQYDNLKQAIEGFIVRNPDTPLLFMCDIIGGTPFKLAVEHTHQIPHAIVVAGANISAIIEVVLQRDMHHIEKLAELAIAETKDTVVRFIPTFSNRNVVCDSYLATADGI